MTPVIPVRAAQGPSERLRSSISDKPNTFGTEFTSEVEHALSRVAENPEIGSPMRRGARKVLVRRFPYLVIYRVLPDHVLVLAVGHQRRHPDFWLNRG